MTDRELLDSYARTGSPEAMGEIVRRHADKVYGACRAILGNDAEAEDAVQATFLVLMRKARRLSEKTVLAGWLFLTAKNVAIDVAKRAARRARHEQEAANMVSDSGRVSVGSSKELRSRLVAALAALPARMRNVVILRWIEGRSQAEVAEEMRCSEGTVSSTLSHAREKLRARLGRGGVAPSAVALTGLLTETLASPAPAALVASVQAVCLGKAAASTAALTVAQGAMKTMALGKLKVAALVLTATTVLGGGGAVTATRILAAAPVLPARLKGIPVNTWVQVVGKHKGPAWSNLVYDPVGKKVLRWGCWVGTAGNGAVHSLDLATGGWRAEYPTSIKGGISPSHLTGLRSLFSTKSNHPSPTLAFDQVTYDTRRKRAVYAGPLGTYCYDPAAKKWSDMKAHVELWGARHPGGPPVGWGAMCYDPVNDEIVMSPHAACINWDDFESIGKLSGHLGTCVYSYKTNLWRRVGTELGSEEVRAARKRVGELRVKIAKLLKKAFRAEAGGKREEDKALAGKLEGLAAEVAKASAPASCRALLAECGKALTTAAKNCSSGKLKEAHAACGAALRAAEDVLEGPLRVEPRERAFSRMVYDPKAKSIVLFGGEHTDYKLNDTWVYNCAKRQWTEKKPKVSPPPRCDHILVYHAKSGRVLMAGGRGAKGTDKELWSYDVAANTWRRHECKAPWTRAWDSWACAYDRERDLVVLDFGGQARYGRDNLGTYVLRPDLSRTAAPTPWQPVKREMQPIPPDDPAVVAKLKSLPANKWVRAGCPKEPPRRGYGMLSLDPTTGWVHYAGGGHSTYGGDDVALYQPGANRWIRSHRPQDTNRLPPYRKNCGQPAGINYGGSHRTRHFHRYATNHGVGYYPSSTQVPYSYGPPKILAWARGIVGPYEVLKFHRRPPCIWFLHDMTARRWTAMIPRAKDGSFVQKDKKHPPVGGDIYPYGSGFAAMGGRRRHFFVYDATTGAVHITRIPEGMASPGIRAREGFDSCYCKGREEIFVWWSRSERGKRQPVECSTWTYNIKANAWKQLKPKKSPPPSECGRVQYVPGQDVVFAITRSRGQRKPPQWAYSFKRNTWADMGSEVFPGYDPTGPLAQMAYSEKYGVFVIQGGRTGLMRPDFDKLKWE